MTPAADIESIQPKNLTHLPGALVAPGFVDLHVHGAAGHDFMEASEASLRAISQFLARHGTTAFFATTMSASDEALREALGAFAGNRRRVGDGAAALGIHMEGPYLNAVRRGAHRPAFLKQADVKEFLGYVAISGNTVGRVTVAPEMDPSLALTRAATELGIHVSIGHSDATEEQARAAVEAGAREVTHIFNAMRPLHQREPGILGVALTDSRLYTEIIADGVHVHPTLLTLLVQAKGVDRTLLVTDASSATGMRDGRYPLGEEEVVVENGVCRNPEGNLAGSTLTLDRAVRNLVSRLEIPLHEALIAASATPARCMDIRSKGIIGPGADADLVFLDENLEVLQTMVAGLVVYRRNSPGTSGT